MQTFVLSLSRPPSVTVLLALLAAMLTSSLCSTASAQDEWDNEEESWEEGEEEPKGADADGEPAPKEAPAPKAKKPAKKKVSKSKRKAGSSEASLPLRLGASLGLFLETGAIRDDERREALRDNRDQEYDLGLDPSVMLQLWLPLSRMFHVSTGLRYGGVYEASTGEDDDDIFAFGQQFELHAGLEAWINILSAIDVVVGLRAGAGVIFSTDDLDAEIDRVQGQGADAWSTPRLGLFFTPVAGARWQIADAVAVRGDVAVSFGRYFLFNYSGDIAGVYYERSAVANFTRYEFSAGIEFAL